VVCTSAHHVSEYETPRAGYGLTQRPCLFVFTSHHTVVHQLADSDGDLQTGGNTKYTSILASEDYFFRSSPQRSSPLRHQHMQQHQPMSSSAEHQATSVADVDDLPDEPPYKSNVATSVENTDSTTAEEVSRTPSNYHDENDDDDDDKSEEEEEEEKAGLSLLFAASLLQSSRSSNIDLPRQMDVLCGRGGGINKHVGNRMYRRVVEYNKSMYRHVPKRHRMLVSQSIVQTILNEGGRFLQADGSSSSSRWKEIPFRRAVQKTSQALRERVEDESSSAASDGGGDLPADSGIEGTETVPNASNDDAAVSAPVVSS
jgi:hypothetical protein